jgi:hypothetical protein
MSINAVELERRPKRIPISVLESGPVVAYERKSGSGSNGDPRARLELKSARLAIESLRRTSL